MAGGRGEGGSHSVPPASGLWEQKEQELGLRGQELGGMRKPAYTNQSAQEARAEVYL